MVVGGCRRGEGGVHARVMRASLGPERDMVVDRGSRRVESRRQECWVTTRYEVISGGGGGSVACVDVTGGGTEDIFDGERGVW